MFIKYLAQSLVYMYSEGSKFITFIIAAVIVCDKNG